TCVGLSVKRERGAHWGTPDLCDNLLLCGQERTFVTGRPHLENWGVVYDGAKVLAHKEGLGMADEVPVEQWNAVVGAEGYEVSDAGRVRSFRYARTRRPGTEPKVLSI